MNKETIKVKTAYLSLKLKLYKMEFYQNLIPQTGKMKNKLGLSILIVLLFSFIGAQVYINVKTEMQLINYFNIALWVLYTLLLFFQIFTGKRIDSLFGKAYIHITDEALKLKPTVLKKEQSIFWKDLSHLSMKPTYIKVTGKEGKIISIDFKNLEYQAVQDLKEIIKKLIGEGTIRA